MLHSTLFICMFVLPNHYKNEFNYKQQVKSLDTGAREFKKLISFRFHYWMVRLRAPIFIHPNLFKMPNQKREQVDYANDIIQNPITAESIVKDILSLDEPENIREDLRFMMDAFFLYHEAPDDRFKGRVYDVYQTLNRALKNMGNLNPRKEVCHVNA